ncbi:hypothetical protein ACFX2I_024600 [Malus domestica]|uniref:CN hydrolase domain-containing protein n=1 Tax=Malus domestica TaxID=3750 RepID=A0A498H802_MALDO|nr:hypothetical protein DVH24_027665 [Malus domestica]
MTSVQFCHLLSPHQTAAGAKLICFSKSFSFIGAKDGDSLKIAELLEGQILQKHCFLARESGIWLSLGGLQEKGSDNKHLCNTHVVVNDAGNIRSTHRKIHLFDANIPGGKVYKEGSFTEPARRRRKVIEFMRQVGAEVGSSFL